jgi:hypothetical protein
MTKKEASKTHLSELQAKAKELIAKFEELRGFL